jgi:thiol-disulfide isomerase/thioredoxin
MMTAMARWFSVGFILATNVGAVKELYSHKEFNDLLAQAKNDGRPVIIDYYSMSCGPCHMIAPVFRKISKEFAGRAYFRKVDVNRNQQTAGMQRISSMPTFQFWMKGKNRHQFSGADEYSLREWSRRLVEEFERDDVE